MISVVGIICYLAIKALYGLINYYLISYSVKRFCNKDMNAKANNAFHIGKRSIFKIIVGAYGVTFALQMFPLIEFEINETFSLIILFSVILHYLIFEVTNFIALSKFENEIYNGEVLKGDSSDLKEAKNQILVARIIIILFNALWIFLFGGFGLDIN